MKRSVSTSTLCVLVVGLSSAQCSALSDEPTFELPPSSGCEPVVCDVSEPECHQVLMEITACMMGVPSLPVPTVRLMTSEEYEDAVLEDLGASISDGGEDEPWAAAYQQLGFLPPALTLAEGTAAVRSGAVQGLYSPDKEEVTLVGRGDPNNQAFDTGVLVHEFVHHYQHVRWDLVEWRQAWAGTSDDDAASRCLTEGEARLIQYQFYAELIYGWVEWEETYEAFLPILIESVQDSDFPLYSALFQVPYLVGPETLRRELGTAVVGSFESFYESPLTSVSDFARPDESAASGPDDAGPDDPGPDDPEPCYPAPAPDGYVAVDSDELGVAGALAFAVVHAAPETDGWALAQAVVDDRILLFRPSDASEADEESGFAWRLRFADSSSASEMASVAEGTSELRVLRDGSIVVIYGGTTPGTLEDWTATAECGPEPNRVSPAATRQQNASTCLQPGM